MKNNKLGFTLIELLAVIIILAIVALIATPIVLNVVDDARISAGKSESQLILSGINNYCKTIEMKKQLGQLTDGDIDCSTKSSFTTEEISKMVNLGNANISKVTYANGKVIELEVESNNHKYLMCSNGTMALEEVGCEQNDNKKMITFTWDNCGRGDLTFTVEAGTTWRNLVNSELNTVDPEYVPDVDDPEDMYLFNVFFEGEEHIGCCVGGSAVGDADWNAVSPDDEIISGYSYISLP